MMDRDERLTGHARKQKVRTCHELPFTLELTMARYGGCYGCGSQQSEPTPPEGFDTSSVWYTSKAT